LLDKARDNISKRLNEGLFGSIEGRGGILMKGMGDLLIIYIFGSIDGRAGERERF
jgi:hypothetical protein